MLRLWWAKLVPCLKHRPPPGQSRPCHLEVSFNFLSSAGSKTQGFTHTRQALHHYTPSLLEVSFYLSFTRPLKGSRDGL